MPDVAALPGALLVLVVMEAEKNRFSRGERAETGSAVPGGPQSGAAGG